MLRRSMMVALSLLLTLGLSLLGAGQASAAPAGWADWEPLTGSSREFSTTMQQQPAGFPAAAVTSDSVGGSAVGVQSGASTFLAPQTPPGAKYGSSRSRPYLNLRPNGLNAAPPSTTTYTFERPTPAGGWTFVLGDVDADAVAVSGTDAAGEPLTATQLGFQGVFNYCAQGVSPKPGCTGAGNDGSDLPTWNPATGTLTGGGSDTAGASGWFEPTVSVGTLTLVFSRTSGSPVYQTWFFALAYDIAGTVTAPEDQQQGITLQLLDGDGEVIAETETDADGGYSFPGYASYDDYQVQVVPPTGLVADGPTTRDANLSESDQPEVDFVLVEPAAPLGAVSGTVTTEAGGPVPAAEITITGPEGLEQTATTDANGDYEVGELTPGDYSAELTTPDGYEPVGPTELTFTIDDEGTEVTEVDFALRVTEPSPTPTPSEPTPSEPAPSEPTPTEPTPSEPTPSETPGPSPTEQPTESPEPSSSPAPPAGPDHDERLPRTGGPGLPLAIGAALLIMVGTALLRRRSATR